MRWGISSSIAYKKVDLPEPTLPTIPYYFPFLMVKSIFLRTGGLSTSQKLLKLTNSAAFSELIGFTILYSLWRYLLFLISRVAASSGISSNYFIAFLSLWEPMLSFKKIIFFFISYSFFFLRSIYFERKNSFNNQKQVFISSVKCEKYSLIRTVPF